MDDSMRIIHDLDEITETARGWLAGGLVGFIPTMGDLHAGHTALIRAARQECEYSIVSIFVNPLQFGQDEDPALYPHDLAHDLAFLGAEQVDVAFLPRVEDMYPPNFSTYVVPSGPVAERLEGALRPAHMRGYATNITKLLQLVRPDVAYFGQKNAHHVALIHQLVRDLNIDVKVQVLPTARDTDGLPLGGPSGSCNHLLSPTERRAATLLYQALLAGRASIEQGERHTVLIEQAMTGVTSVTPDIKVEYATACDAYTLEHPGDTLPDNPHNLLLVIAARVGPLRLTDNILLRDGHWQI